MDSTYGIDPEHIKSFKEIAIKRLEQNQDLFFHFEDQVNDLTAAKYIESFYVKGETMTETVDYFMTGLGYKQYYRLHEPLNVHHASKAKFVAVEDNNVIYTLDLSGMTESQMEDYLGANIDSELFVERIIHECEHIQREMDKHSLMNGTIYKAVVYVRMNDFHLSTFNSRIRSSLTKVSNIRTYIHPQFIRQLVLVSPGWFISMIMNIIKNVWSMNTLKSLKIVNGSHEYKRCIGAKSEKLMTFLRG